MAVMTTATDRIKCAELASKGGHSLSACLLPVCLLSVVCLSPVCLSACHSLPVFLKQSSTPCNQAVLHAICVDLTTPPPATQNETALEVEVASLWERVNEQGAALLAAQQAQHSAESNAAERESELLAQLDAVSMKLQVHLLWSRILGSMNHLTAEVCIPIIINEVCIAYNTRQPWSGCHAVVLQ